jgi:hypothetical protein
MLASEIVQELCLRLPQETGLFTTDIPVLSLTRNDEIITAACSEAHGLKVGDAISITGAINPISISSLSRSGTVGTVVTALDHDLTNPVATTITISSADESVFNGTFTRINVDNRRTVTFTMADTGATSSTGGVLENAEKSVNSYNITYTVGSTPTKSNFTFTQATTTLPSPIGDSIIARTNPRIGSAINVERAQEMYTAKNINELCLFVVLDEVAGLKNRSILTENIDNLTPSNEYRQQVTQPFSLYLFVPQQDELSGANGRDIAETLFSSLTKSLLFHKFDSLLFAGTNSGGTVNFVSHGAFSYNAATYVHEYTFVQTIEILFEDTIGHSPDVAFRDIEFDIFPKVTISGEATTSGSLGGDVNLDDVPL